MALQVINITKWIEENKKFFLPPVCNKMMHNDQLKIMFVVGPNIRKDYHIEEGEEFFYMLKGDMCLKVIEQGKHKDIVIKEGEVFLLPARIPHSPQRYADTVGLVIERKRDRSETDILRYFVNDNTTEVLYEKAFYCKDLGVQLAPIIKEFFNSEACKTGIPDEENILSELPFQLDQTTVLNKSTSLTDKLDQADVTKDLFNGENQFDIKVYSGGENTIDSGSVENWIWQLNGSSLLIVNAEEKTLQFNDSVLIPTNASYTWKRNKDCKALVISQKRPTK